MRISGWTLGRGQGILRLNGLTSSLMPTSRILSGLRWINTNNNTEMVPEACERTGKLNKQQAKMENEDIDVLKRSSERLCVEILCSNKQRKSREEQRLRQLFLLLVFLRSFRANE